MDLLVYVLVLAVVIGLIYWLLTVLPLPPPVKTIVLVVFALIAIIVLLQVLGVFGGRPLRLLR